MIFFSWQACNYVIECLIYCLIFEPEAFFCGPARYHPPAFQHQFGLCSNEPCTQSSNQAGAGTPIRWPVAFLNEDMNFSFVTALGAAQLKTPSSSFSSHNHFIMRHTSSMCTQLNSCLPLPCLPPSANLHRLR